MNIQDSFICIDCDSIFTLQQDSSGDFGYLIDRYKNQCPSCGSKAFMPLANIILPITKRGQPEVNVVMR